MVSWPHFGEAQRVHQPTGTKNHFDHSFAHQEVCERIGQAMEAPREWKKFGIIVVENEVLLRLDLAFQLRFDVTEAASAREALTILERGGDVDLILTDIRMPGEIDGMDLRSQS